MSSKLNFQIAVRTKKKELSYSEKYPSGVERLEAIKVNNFCDGWVINSPESEKSVKPNPLTLQVIIEKNNKIKIYRDSLTLEQLTNKFKDTFKERTENLVFRNGTNEIEKSVFVLASPNLKFADVVPTLEALLRTEQNPTICIQFKDDTLKSDVIKNN